MRKVFARILVAAMLMAYAVPVYAASGGWTADYAEPENSSNPINRDTEFIEATTLDSSDYIPEVSGKVLHIKFARSKQANTYLYVENSLSGTLVKNQKYDFSFYVKGTFQNKGIFAGIGTNENLTSGGRVSFVKTNRYTVTPKDNGWSLYTFSSINYDDSGSFFSIKVVELCEDLYIDNVSLVPHGGGDELIVDGGFEATSFIETDDVGNQAQYAPKNLIVTQKSEHILVSWRNPENTNLSKVSLYDITTGEEVKITDSLSKTANAYVNYDVTGLTAGENYTFKVVCEFGAKTVTESIISGKASSAMPSNVMSVYMSGNQPGTSYIEHNDTHSGGGALKVISNKQSWESNNFMKVQTKSIAFNEANEYEISLWIKGTFPSYTDTIKDDTPSKFKYDGTAVAIDAVETDENGWKHVVFRINKTGTRAVAIMAETKTDVLVDDIEVYKIENNERTTNLLTQDFESTNYSVDDVTDLSGEVDRSTAKINFTAPDGVNMVRVYVKDGENLSKRAEVFAENGSVSFTHLKNDYNYTYVVKAVDNYNNESAGKEIILTPTPRDFEIVEYGLYKGIVLQNALQGSQNYTAKAVIKNNKVDEGVKAQVIAVLRKDGERINAVASDVANIVKTKYDDSATYITAEIPTADISDGEYELSVYLWDGLDTMTVLAPFKIYKEVAE